MGFRCAFSNYSSRFYFGKREIKVVLKELFAMDHEAKEKRGKAVGELGYGIMWFFLAVILELLYFLDQIHMNFYHLLAGIMLFISFYKFYKGVKKFKKLREANLQKGSN